MPPKTLVKVGGGAILLAVVMYSLTFYWLATRTFEPVNMPVALESGRLQTVDFSINLREDYNVRILVDDSLDDWTEGRCSDKLWQEMDWKVYRLDSRAPNKKELWASSAEMQKQGLRPVWFDGFHGRYRLEWSVPASSVCLNPRHPQLRVWADRSDYETTFGFVLIACTLVGMLGAGAILRAAVIWLQKIVAGKWMPRIFPDMAVRNVIPFLRHRPMPVMRVLPDFRTAWFCVIGVLTVLFFMFLTRWGWQSKGLQVDFNGERTVMLENNPWTETMAVYVDAHRGFFVNGKPVQREELHSKLQDELSRRGVWEVYFEADANCLYMDAVYAIDTIQGLGAKVIWITPKTREEWKHRVLTHANNNPEHRVQ